MGAPDAAEKNCELLFEYLRSILYDMEVQQPDMTALDEPYRDLRLGLQFLEQAVTEMKAYSAALSRGDLSAPTPARDNFLCENLKNIHADLKHLTWQAKQVAKGDYSQHVSFLGEFSEAFNTMTEQLREREQSLMEEAQREKEHAEMMEKYNKLLLNLIRHSKEDILVTSVQEPRILYASDNHITGKHNGELFRIFLQKQRDNALTAAAPDAVHDWSWEAEDSENRFYRITTVRMEWHGEPAYAHIILEMTAEKLEQGKLEQAAYFDKLTKIGNRRCFDRRTAELLKSGVQLLFCYCDLDGLKYVNDTFGHAEGDLYLCTFVAAVKRQIRENDVFVRMGGDEFCVVLKSCPHELAAEKLCRAQKAFAESGPEKPYEKSFSFGIVEIPADHGAVDLEEVLHEADNKMYLQKREHKRARA